MLFFIGNFLRTISYLASLLQDLFRILKDND